MVILCNVAPQSALLQTVKIVSEDLSDMAVVYLPEEFEVEYSIALCNTLQDNSMDSPVEFSPTQEKFLKCMRNWRPVPDTMCVDRGWTKFSSVYLRPEWAPLFPFKVFFAPLHITFAGLLRVAEQDSCVSE